MKKIIICFVLFVVCCASVFAQVQGHVYGMDGKKVIKVWGTHYERGYAMGYLLGDVMMQGFNEYFMEYLLQNNPTLYNMISAYFHSSFTVDDQYVQEMDGMHTGMVDAGFSTFVPILNRDVTSEDFLMLNALIDLSSSFDLGEFGCSSISSWGSATQADPQLAGEVVITRNLDWTVHSFLQDNPLLIVHFPSEPDEQNWMSFSYPGFLGALSAINESQVSAFLNMGNNHSHGTAQIYHPILFSIRNGVERLDYDGNGQCSTGDITQAISDKIQLAGHIVHCTDSAGGIAIECNNSAGVAVRTTADNVYIPDDNLVATNHFRVLYPPSPCSRYGHFIDSLSVNYEITLDRSWDVAAGAGGISNNMQTIEYAQAANCIKWSTALPGFPAYQLGPVYYEIDWLFSMPSSTPGQVVVPVAQMHVYPNPVQLSGNHRGEVTSIAFELSNAYRSVQVEIYNIRGQKVKQLFVSNADLRDGFSSKSRRGHLSSSVSWDGSDVTGQPVSSGVYLCRLNADGQTMAQQKMMVIR